MGWDRPSNLAELLDRGWHLRVRCPKCGRTSVFPVREVVGYFRSKGWNMALEVAGGRFRCEGWPPHDPGCGHRGARLGIVSIYQQPTHPKPAPLPQDRKKEIRDRRG